MEKIYNEYIKGFTEPKERIVYRIKFTKNEQVKYIGHLDIMRIFQRAIKRAKLPISYSNGFNPHQIISFASPLTLGTTSIGEYCDLQFNYIVDTNIIRNSLNSVLPQGIEILDTILLKANTQKAMASICAASYEAILDKNITHNIIKNNIEGYMNQNEIIVMKKTKKILKETNIKDDIFEIKDISSDDCPKLYMFVASGSKRNIKPENVVEGFYNYMGLKFNKYNMIYKRIDLFREENGKYFNLLEGVAVL